MVRTSMTPYHLLCLLLLSCTAESTHESGVFHFEVITSDWSDCSLRSAGCSRSREAVCVRSIDNRTAPWYFCTDRGLDRPQVSESCSSCAQSCAVSQWSDWSECSCEVDQYRYRTRNVVSPARNGGEGCPALAEREACPCAFVGPFESQPRAHTWKTGQWGACVALNTSSQCGAGLRSRLVDCVNMQGTITPASNCLSERAYSSIIPPAAQTLCEVPCPCVFGDWGNFSTCTPQCEQQVPTGIQIRRRSVLQVPTHGLSCPALEESRPCNLNDSICPQYSWASSTWSQCHFQNEATCGAGYQTRFIYCLETLNGTARTVDHSRCEELSSNPRPAAVSSCSVRCPEPCVLGEWSNWTECATSCMTTYSNRTRPVLVTPYQGVCPHTLELRPCPVRPCARWLVGDYDNCFVLSSDCGNGHHTRSVRCVDDTDQRILDTMCAGLPKPSSSTPCRVPCPNECVLSSWTDWSLCSHTCGGLGNQTRTRHFIANGTSCPIEGASLVDVRECGSEESCNPPVFSVAPSPWGNCVAVSQESRGSGDSPTEQVFDTVGHTSSCGESGYRNRTNVCLRDGQTVSMSECPISYQQLEMESCQVECSRDCVYSEWSEFGECSASCGMGMRRRSRYLIQHSDATPCSVSSHGFDYDYEMCYSQCDSTGTGVVRGVAWHSSNWSTCYLYEGYSPQGQCGIGYQNRTIRCVNISTGHFVSELECSSLDMPRPPAIMRCHVQCPTQCLVTEWPELEPCSEDGVVTRKRQIVGHTGCSNWTTCCPHLTSIPLEQNVQCSDPAGARMYDYEFVHRDFSSNCIFDDPSAVCGNVGGKFYRELLCAISFTTSIVDLSFCNKYQHKPNLDLEQDCTVKCEVDCVQSDWSEWSACSTTCGYGQRTRTRDITSDAQDVGRKCGPLLETDVCVNVPCPSVEIVPGPFSACSPNNMSASCGVGYQRREAVCLVDGRRHDLEVCHGVGVANISFSLDEPCTSPCPAECVVGQWGEWSPIGLCQVVRHRNILRQPDSPFSCPALQEIGSCSTATDDYSWEVGSWLDCIVPYNSSASLTPGQYCGLGRQGRSLTCRNGSRGYVHERHCEESGLMKPHVYQNCSLPCPIDCELGPFSDWTECNGCYRSTQRRERQIIIEPNEWGRQCREHVQERQCAPVGCENSTLITHPTLDLVDYTVGGQCGQVLTDKSHSCTSNTVYVSPDICEDGSSDSAEVYATLPCPTSSCSYSEWSDWSTCQTLCAYPDQPYRFRYRRLESLSPTETSGCEDAQVETLECVRPVIENWNGTMGMNVTSKSTPSPTEPCIDFQWLTLEWNEDQRDVHCESAGDVRVNNGACPVATRPVSRRQTCMNVSCSQYGSCLVNDGVCSHTCQEEFELVGNLCLPVSGCLDHTHCLIPNTECDINEKVCKCKQNYKQSEIGDLCVLVAPTATPTSKSEGTSPTTSARTPVPEATTGNISVTEDITLVVPPQGLQLGILVLMGAVPLCLIILVVVVLIIITYRCSRNLERRGHHEVQRRHTKPSISSPSVEMKRKTDSNSSGFIDGPDAEHYGLAASTFLPDGQAEDCIDEPVDPTAHVTDPFSTNPVVVQAPITPSYHGGHHREGSPGPMHFPVGYLYRHSYRQRYFSDGGMTDMTYTTDDDDTVATTSVAPSSPGSPSTSHRRIPSHITEDSAQSEDHTHQGQDPTHQGQDPTHPPQHRYNGEGAMEGMPENPYVSMHRSSPIYARVKQGSHNTPTSPRSSGPHSRRSHLSPGERDGRIALGLDNSIVRAAIQAGGSLTPTSAHSAHPGGKRRRRRSHAHKHHPKPSWYQDPHYHYFDNGRYRRDNYRSDGNYSSEYDLSEAEHTHQRFVPGGSGGSRTLPPHLRHSTYNKGNNSRRQYYEDSFYHGNADKHGHSLDSHYSARDNGRLSSPSTRSRPPDSSHHSLNSPAHYRQESHNSTCEYPSSSTCHYSSSENHHTHPDESDHAHPEYPDHAHHDHAHPEYPDHAHHDHAHPDHAHHDHAHPDHAHPDYHRHHSHGDSYHHSHGRGRYYSEHDYRYSDKDHRSSDRSRYSPDWDPRYSPERSHSSSRHRHHSPPRRHHSEGHHHSTSYESRHHHWSNSTHPPPDFTPPVPPHANLATPTGDGYDTYDYPTNYQPQALLKVKESERDNNSQYARPRPRHLLASPQEGRVTSPYDYPRVKCAELTASASSSGKATPTSPTKTAPSSTTMKLIPLGSLLQENEEVSDDGIAPLNNNSDLQSGTPMKPQQSTTSLGFTPQYAAASLVEEREPHPQPHLPSVPTVQSSVPQQILISTPVSLQVPPPSLNIQVASDSHELSPHGSPLLSSARAHPPSPLVFNSTSMFGDSPHHSGELD